MSPLWQKSLKKESDKDINYWIESEINGFRESLLASVRSRHKDIQDLVKDPESFDSMRLLPSPLFLMATEIEEYFSKFAKTNEELQRLISKFLSNEMLKNIPFVRINHILIAAHATRVSCGTMKAEKLKGSLINDCWMVATILPFCDAIFLDRQIAGFLRDNPMKTIVEPMPKVFSLSNKEEFIAYLDEIEATASATHLAQVKEVYGEKWGSPYTSVLAEFCKEDVGDEF